MAAPFAGVQAPGVYRHKLGYYEVTVLSDGNLPFDASESLRVSISRRTVLIIDAFTGRRRA
jgi:hypothetical protein